MKNAGRHERNHPAPAVTNMQRLTLAFAAAVSRRQKDKSDNLVVSPYNALAALSMAAAGAEGKTREQMAKILYGVEGKDLDAAVRDYAVLNEKIIDANRGQVELTTANGIWVNDRDLTLSDGYQKILKDVFKASASLEDFSSPAVVGKINQWAKDNTKGLIPKVIDRVDPAALSVLASALYFKGAWTRKFDKGLTKDEDFVFDGAKGGRALTAMMSQYFSNKGDIRYQEGQDYQAVTMTYGEKDREKKLSPTMSLTLIRPMDPALSARDWLEAQAKTPDAVSWLDSGSFRPVTGRVALPRLDMTQTHDLIPALGDMGIKDAFVAGQADFSGMTAEKSKDVFIGKVSHDVAFKTDEEGSEGAAVTVVGMMRSESLAPREHPIDLRLDRSFVLVVSDIATGTPVFIGAVNKPNQQMKPHAGATPGR